MNKTVIIFLFLCFNAAFAQDLKMTLQDVRTEDKMFSGMIDDKYEISVYLKYHELSPDNLGIYSVKGWYYYEKVKKKIPLVGVYDGQLTLFALKSTKLKDKVLTFDYPGMTWAILDSVKAITDFDEKLVFSDEDKSVNQWTDGKKKLKLDLYASDYQIHKEYQLLNISSGNKLKSINLNEVIRYHYGFELSGYKKTESTLWIMLKYEHGSRFNVQGMCGAGMEIGYIILSYDKDYNLLSSEETQIESCLDNIANDEIKTNQKSIKKYKVSDKNEKTKTITVDEKLIRITTE